MDESALNEQPEDILDYLTWGVKTRGATLFINPRAYFPADVKTVVIDVETDEADNFVGLGTTWSHDRVYYYTELSEYLLKSLSGVNLIGHNIKSDAQWLRKWGINITPEQLVYDTMLASYVQDSTRRSHALKDLSSELFGIKRPSYKDIVGRGKQKVTLDKHPIDLVANYCGCDVLDTYKLYEYFTKVLSLEQRAYLEEIELPTMRALMLMEERGVSVNAEYLKTLDNKFTLEVKRLVERVRSISCTIENVNSDKQVGDFLVSKGFALQKTATGKNSVSNKSLEPYQGVPFIKTLTRYSELEKLLSTYTGPLLEASLGQSVYSLHASFNQAITHTGRLSSSNPNLQNIPTRTDTGALVRRAFIAPTGCILIDADYSQIEPRLFAHESQDPELLKIFREGHDLYDYVAAAIGSSRSVAKTVWLALSYNAGPFKISQTAKIPISQAYTFINKMKQKFSTAFKWKEATILKASSDKYVNTLYGRRIPIQEEGLAPNYKIQGSAAEIMKKAIIATSEFNPVLTVHDELLFQVRQSDRFPYEVVDSIRGRMENAAKLSVPLLVEVGTGSNWQDAKN